MIALFIDGDSGLDILQMVVDSTPPTPGGTAPANKAADDTRWLKAYEGSCTGGYEWCLDGWVNRVG